MKWIQLAKDMTKYLLLSLRRCTFLEQMKSYYVKKTPQLGMSKEFLC